jgi:hypothetical protein
MQPQATAIDRADAAFVLGMVLLLPGASALGGATLLTGTWLAMSMVIVGGAISLISAGCKFTMMVLRSSTKSSFGRGSSALFHEGQNLEMNNRQSATTVPHIRKSYAKKSSSRAR